MKKMTLIIAFAILSTFANAQGPGAIAYQAVARNSSGSLMQDHFISLRFTIHSTSAGGPVVYQETNTVTTNKLGLFTVNIGGGTPVTGTFSGIDWSTGTMFTQVEMDTTGGTDFVNMGTSQMLSVPYALYAAKSATASYTGGAGISISGNNIINTLPDQTVNLTGSGATIVSGTYPNFTVSTPVTTNLWAVNGNNLYNDTGSYVGIGTATPAQALDVNGTTKTTNLQLTGGATAGYLLRSDSSGNASWVNPLTATGPLRYTGSSYIGVNSGAGGTGTREGTANNLSNISIGNKAGYATTTGANNIALGDSALMNNDASSGMIAIGNNALNQAYYLSDRPGSYAIAIGYQAMQKAAYPKGSIAIGYQALSVNSDDVDYNTAVGYQSLRTNEGFENSAYGAMAMSSSNGSSYNSAFGAQVLLNSQGDYNSGFGYQALVNTTGNSATRNTASGYQAGKTNTTGSNNTFIGANADATLNNLSNATAIGYNAQVSLSNSIVLGNGANVGIGTSSPAKKLEVVGGMIKTDSLRITAGAASGYLLQSDASGNASWTSPTSLASAGGLHYTGSSYIGTNSGAGGTGNSEGTSADLGNINIGNHAGYANTSGSDNIVLGDSALASNSSLNGVIAIGAGALSAADYYSSIPSNYVIAIGYQAMQSANYPYHSIAIGYQSQSTQEGQNLDNTSIGFQTLHNTTSGAFNSAFGSQAMASGSAGQYNAAFGYRALFHSAGSYNSAFGYQALLNAAGNNLGSNLQGSRNTAFGYQAGQTITTGSKNTFIGYAADASSSDLTNATAIGYNASVGASNSLVLGNGANVGIGVSAPPSLLSVGSSSQFQVAGTGLVVVDADGENDGGLDSNALVFGGSGSGQAIVSQVTSGTNQNGLDLYTSGSRRIAILSNGNVGVGSSFPGSKLDVNGPIGMALSKQTGSAPIAVDNTAAVWYITGSASVTLPSALASPNRTYTIVNRTTNSKNISSYIDLSGNTQTSISANSSIQIISDGTNWLQIK